MRIACEAHVAIAFIDLRVVAGGDMITFLPVSLPIFAVAVLNISLVNTRTCKRATACR
jgi:hypothetical protein